MAHAPLSGRRHIVEVGGQREEILLV